MLKFYKHLYSKGLINLKTEFDIELDTPLFNTGVTQTTRRHVVILKILEEDSDMNFEVEVKPFDIKMLINWRDIKTIDGMDPERYGAAFAIALDCTKIRSREL